MQCRQGKGTHRVWPLVGAVQGLGGLFAVLRNLPAEEQTLLRTSHDGVEGLFVAKLQHGGFRAHPEWDRQLCMTDVSQMLCARASTLVSGAFCNEGSRVS